MKSLCKKYNLTKDQFLGKDTVGGSLYLRGLTSIPKGFNPTVGGDLYLGGLTSIPKGFNPTVGGSLYLSGLTSIPKGFNPTVGGYLELEGLTSNYKKITLYELEKKLIWENKKYRIFDRIFCEVLNKYKSYYKVKINNKKMYVIDNGFCFSHGETLKKANENLIYKTTDRDKSKYSDLTEKSIISFEEAIKMYRVITGACEFGCKNFVSKNMGNKNKDKYSIKEILDLTKNEYGNNELRNFLMARN
jgi:hypothetical protein